MNWGFVSVTHAYKKAMGTSQCTDIHEWVAAWQYLYDNNAQLSEPDELYMEKLICDGVILTPENYDELNGMNYIPHGSAMGWGMNPNSYNKQERTYRGESVANSEIIRGPQSNSVGADIHWVVVTQ